MRYRKLSATGDYMFGSQQGDFWVNVPDAVAQAVQTRLRLQLGEWYLDTTDGTDWQGSVLGERTRATRDPVIRQRVLLTPGATQINGYNSQFDPNSRRFNAAFSLDTQFGKFGLFSTDFLTEPTTPQPEPPAEPVDVTVAPTSDTSILVNWVPYHTPAQETFAYLSGVGAVTVAEVQHLVGTALLPGSGGLTASPVQRQLSGTIRMQGAGSMSVKAQVILRATIRLSGAGGLRA